MIRTVFAEAAEEVADAATWYQGRRIGLGDAFLAEWQKALNLIYKDPISQPLVEYDVGSLEVRRCRLWKFPYAVFYVCRPDEVLIVAVAHGSQDPLYWLDRLPPH